VGGDSSSRSRSQTSNDKPTAQQHEAAAKDNKGGGESKQVGMSVRQSVSQSVVEGKNLNLEWHDFTCQSQNQELQLPKL
jgi:hypothetical protein